MGKGSSVTDLLVNEKRQCKCDGTSDTSVAQHELIDGFQLVETVAIGESGLKQNTCGTKREVASFDRKNFRLFSELSSNKSLRS